MTKPDAVPMTTMTPETLAVARIIADLKSRSGLRQEWDAIDNDIREEITETWTDIIRQEWVKGRKG